MLGIWAGSNQCGTRWWRRAKVFARWRLKLSGNLLPAAPSVWWKYYAPAHKMLEAGYGYYLTTDSLIQALVRQLTCSSLCSWAAFMMTPVEVTLNAVTITQFAVGRPLVALMRSLAEHYHPRCWEYGYPLYFFDITDPSDKAGKLSQGKLFKAF